MKNIAIGILLIATVVFGGLYFQQTRKSTQAQSTADSLQEQVSQLEAGLEEQARQTTRAREELEGMRTDAASRVQAAQAAVKASKKVQEDLTNELQRVAAQAPAQTATQTTRTNSKPSNPLAEMMKNPEMKEMIKTQQKTALGTMLDKNYGRLFADLHLTPEQSAALKDMILNKQLGAADLGMSMFTGENDASKRAEMVQQMKTANDAADAQIKEFLGEDNYTQFQAYEKSMGERMAISGFKDQLGAGPNALSDTQEQMLTQAMSQERQSFKFTTDFSDQKNMNGDFTEMFTEERMGTYFQEMDKLNKQYLTRAQGILSADQFTGFEKYLTSQQTMQKAGMQMAVKMFGPTKSNGE